MRLTGYDRGALDAHADMVLALRGTGERVPCVRYVACGACATLRQAAEIDSPSGIWELALDLPDAFGAADLETAMEIIHGVRDAAGLDAAGARGCLRAAAWLGAATLQSDLQRRLADLAPTAASPEDLAARFGELAQGPHARDLWQALVDLTPVWAEALPCVDAVLAAYPDCAPDTAETLAGVYPPAQVLDFVVDLADARSEPFKRAVSVAVAACSCHFHPREGLLYTGIWNRAAGLSDLGDPMRRMLEHASDLPADILRASVYSTATRVSLLLQLPAERRPAARKLAPWLTARVTDAEVTATIKFDDMLEFAGCEPSQGIVYARVMPYTVVVRKFQHRVASAAELWHRWPVLSGGVFDLGAATVWKGSREAFQAVLRRARLVRIDIFLPPRASNAPGVKVA